MLTILVLFGYAEIVLCVAALCFLVSKRQWRDYRALGSFLAVRVVSGTTLTMLHQLSHRLGAMKVYQAYFFVYWIAFAVESVLALFIVYGVFRLTLQPLKGLLKVGTIFFCGVAVASEVWALAAAFGANWGTQYMVSMISQLQRNQSLLTLGMLLFIFFALRPAGISKRSRIFGVGLGLGALAINDLMQTAWMTFHPNAIRAYVVVNGAVVCATLVVWTAYFALPEPERGEINFGSPLSRWNQICLGWFA